jgi:hypothetical protein
MPKPRLRVVKNNDPTAVFDDIDALREAMPTTKSRRARATETFARFYHEKALALGGKIGSNGWVILVEIDRLILKGNGRNPVRLTNYRLRELGIGREVKRYQLQKLVEAGVVRVLARERKWTLVLHLWFPAQG